MVIKVLGSKGKRDDQFDGVSGIAIAQDGTIFVVDQYNNRISAYDRNGTRKWIRNTGRAGNEVPASESKESQEVTAQAGMQVPAGITVEVQRLTGSYPELVADRYRDDVRNHYGRNQVTGRIPFKDRAIVAQGGGVTLAGGDGANVSQTLDVRQRDATIGTPKVKCPVGF